MAHNHIHIDPALPLVRQADKGHNRWHPDIAPAVRIASGSSVEMETLDGLDVYRKERAERLRQPCLTDAAGADDGDERMPLQQVADRREVVGATVQMIRVHRDFSVHCGNR